MLLYSYLATEVLSPFFASFLIMNCVFFLVKLIPFLNAVLELNIDFADFFRLFSYLFPNMFLYSIPMAAMIGIIISFTRISNDSEILALKACGISVYQILPPVVVISLAISLIAGYFSIELVPAGDTAMKQLMFQLAKEKVDKGIKEHEFTEALGDLVVYVGRIDRDTGNWQNVWVSDMRGQTVPTITMAKSGQMFTELDKMQVTIVLENGSLHRSVNNQSQIVTFDKYRLSIPIQPPNQDADNISRGAMTMSQLQKMAQEVGPDTPSGRECLVHYHKRLVLPAGCFLLSLIGFSLGLQSGPGKPAVGVPLGLLFFIIYYVCFTIGKRLAESTSLPVGAAMWSPDILFALVMIFMIHITAKERPFLPYNFQEKCHVLAVYLTSKIRFSRTGGSRGQKTEDKGTSGKPQT
ncbi:MAG: LPS export ABC transporter permease LptF [Desulfocapsaceae bacterium]|nr:LPS export ABC transporter permease LptF [Desulfocapsaceae bacterium]